MDGTAIKEVCNNFSKMQTLVRQSFKDYNTMILSIGWIVRMFFEPIGHCVLQPENFYCAPQLYILAKLCKGIGPYIFTKIVNLYRYVKQTVDMTGYMIMNSVQCFN